MKKCNPRKKSEHHREFTGCEALVSGYCTAQIRAKYSIKLPDAFQVAVALATGCEAFLTNDVTFRRVTELQILVLDDFTAAE